MSRTMPTQIHENTFQTIRLLAAVRTFAALRAWEVFLISSMEEFPAAHKAMWDYIFAVQVIADSLGISLTPEDVTPKEPDPDSLVLSLGEDCVTYDRIRPKLIYRFGEHAGVLFHLVQMAFMAEIATDFLRQARLRDADPERKGVLRDERHSAHTMLNAFGQLLSTTPANLTALFSHEIANLFRDLQSELLDTRPTQGRFDRVHQCVEPLVTALVPTLPLVFERFYRGRDLLDRLTACPAGTLRWKEYEDICCELLRFLFVPPFRDVMRQVRTADAHDRRDAVLPLDHQEGFWHGVRLEFGCSQVICEFKNAARALDKSALNQIRVYLSNPAIGRFGLFFHRTSASASLLKAQRQAYSLSRTAILLIDDTLARTLIFARSFLGSADFVLERQKALLATA